MENYRAILKQQEEMLAPTLLRNHNLICKQLDLGDDPCLYVAKSHWTNRFDPGRDSTIGIFFAIWVSPDLIQQQQLAYNIHSKQLRKLPGYKLASRKFADQFRSAIKPRVKDWPGIRLDYGPLTLLQGHEACDLNSFSEKIERRVADFVSIHDQIDKLLAASVT